MMRDLEYKTSNKHDVSLFYISSVPHNRIWRSDYDDSDEQKILNPSYSSSKPASVLKIVYYIFALGHDKSNVS
jgi:hypothetical protein